ncbi:MAG: hypothetical protein K2N03_05335 [Muribaculaceae bacterium]|nr:hypothetical protein [Muribaculaceae bacterium]
MTIINLPVSKSLLLRCMTMEFVRGVVRSRIVPASLLPEPRRLNIRFDEDENDDIGYYASALNTLTSLYNRDYVPSCGANPLRINIGEGGAPCRFFTALASSLNTGSAILLSGSGRLPYRPLYPLTSVINQLGGDVAIDSELRYGKGEPDSEVKDILEIRGRELNGGEVEVNVGISSQFLSALMMSAPLWERGGYFRYGEGKRPVSAPYIAMTKDVMRRYGFKVVEQADGIEVKPAGKAGLTGNCIRLRESDWSAAAAIYECVAVVKPKGHILLPGLLPPEKSLQGDSGCCRLFRKLGVETEFTAEGAEIWYEPAIEKSGSELFDADMSDMPDIVPALVGALLMTGRRFRLCGTETLRHKESDRGAALREEFAKLGLYLKEKIIECADGKIYGELTGEGLDEEGKETGCVLSSSRGDRIFEEEIILSSHGDHRIAMSLAPAMILCPGLRIDRKEVVGKSYPTFYEEIRKFSSLKGNEK